MVQRNGSAGDDLSPVSLPLVDPAYPISDD